MSMNSQSGSFYKLEKVVVRMATCESYIERRHEQDGCIWLFLSRWSMWIISPQCRDKYSISTSHDPSGSRPVPLCLCRQGPRHHLCLSPSCFGGADCSQFSFVIRSHFLRDKPAAHCPSLTNFESLFSMMWKRTPTPTHQLSRRV